VKSKLLNLITGSEIHKGILTIVLSTIIFSCNKKDGVDPVRDDTKEILLAGSEKKTWLIISSKKNDVEWLPECVKDDDWIFARDNQFTRNSTNISCSNGIPDNDQSGWFFENNETWLTFGGGTYEITSLTEEKMILTFPASNGDTYIDTWVKK
jgi:hypothetical protein